MDGDLALTLEETEKISLAKFTKDLFKGKISI